MFYCLSRFLYAPRDAIVAPKAVSTVSLRTIVLLLDKSDRYRMSCSEVRLHFLYSTMPETVFKRIFVVLLLSSLLLMFVFWTGDSFSNDLMSVIRCSGSSSQTTCYPVKPNACKPNFHCFLPHSPYQQN